MKPSTRDTLARADAALAAADETLWSLVELPPAAPGTTCGCSADDVVMLGWNRHVGGIQFDDWNGGIWGDDVPEVALRWHHGVGVRRVAGRGGACDAGSEDDELLWLDQRIDLVMTCWADAEPQLSIQCDQTPVSDLGLCTEHLTQLRTA